MQHGLSDSDTEGRLVMTFRFWSSAPILGARLLGKDARADKTEYMVPFACGRHSDSTDPVHDINQRNYSSDEIARLSDPDGDGNLAKRDGDVYPAKTRVAFFALADINDRASARAERVTRNPGVKRDGAIDELGVHSFTE